MVERGKFFLYDAFLPALDAGRYQLRAEVDLFTDDDTTPDASADVAPHVTHINVTAPRFRLPPDQALLTFPPANSEGAYESRLPQIVLKRRTLPWDRDPATLNAEINGQRVREETPWLALVVIAEGEGTIEHDVPVADCVSEGVVLQGDADTATASRLKVPRSVVQAVFPTIDDLIMLTHVREVNLEDTEAAMGDDDGFLSVVIANRMPQFDRQNCRPKAYTACLINLEGQLDKLPPPAPPREFFNEADLHLSAVHATIAEAIRTGAAVPVTSGGTPRRLDPTDTVAMSEAIRRGEVVFHGNRLIDRAGLTETGPNDLGVFEAGAVLDGDFSGLAGAGAERVFKVEGVFGGFELALDLIFPEPILRFPVLTSWRFTCTGAGSFEGLMQGLDVGLLGTETPGGYKRPLPACTPAQTGEGPGDAPVSQLPLEIAETGHVGMPHLTRAGSEENAWYRGPFSPHRLMRRVHARMDDDGPILAHVSDHLRMMTPEGRQDVSLAVAFETGRLLAMSQPSFVASLMRWRAQRFGAAVLEAKQQALFLDGVLDPLIPRDAFDEAVLGGLLGQRLEQVLFADFARRRDTALGPAGPLVRPGRKIAELGDQPLEVLSTGLGIAPDLLKAWVETPEAPEVLAKAQAAPVELSGVGLLAESDLLESQLDAALDEGLFKLAELAVGREALDAGSLDGIRTFEDLTDFLTDRLRRRAEP